MSLRYLQLQPESSLPDISTINPFRAVVIVEDQATPDWQYRVCQWLVKSGSMYVMAWGNGCEAWHDSIDLAHLEDSKYEQIPEEKLVITTWHENEPLKDVFWFSKNLAFHPAVEISDTLILHISNQDRSLEYLAQYEAS